MEIELKIHKLLKNKNLRIPRGQKSVSIRKTVRPIVFTDLDGSGLDDGRETQANIYQALINTMDKYPGVLAGVFYWDNWMASDELWAEYWAGRRAWSIRDKPAEEVVRSAYERYQQ